MVIKRNATFKENENLQYCGYYAFCILLTNLVQLICNRPVTALHRAGVEDDTHVQICTRLTNEGTEKYVTINCENYI